MLSSLKSTADRGLSIKSLFSAKFTRAFSASGTSRLNDSVPDVTSNNLSGPSERLNRSDVETVREEENFGILQSPNRASIWSRSQNPKSKAMSGPRFEQTIMHLQPSPLAAIEMVRNQPVRWTPDRIVTCDGGGGPLGHPRIYINTDKPEVCVCNYCGAAFVNRHHKKQIMARKDDQFGLIVEENDAQALHSEQANH
ncbi:hypothetical protein K3495_g8470 [Podosphaera aphanis]|nr:hypothetical protein K3495_g8470 [Podosphaera aphanis]